MTNKMYERLMGIATTVNSVERARLIEGLSPSEKKEYEQFKQLHEIWNATDRRSYEIAKSATIGGDRGDWLGRGR